jgi:crotonobetaine/carnitine-CoA ligase
LDEAKRAATLLHLRGVRPGDHVIVCGDNSKDWLRAWWAIALLGAIVVPVNPSLRGQMLSDVLDLVKPKLVLVDADLAGVWRNPDCPIMEIGQLATGLAAGLEVDIPEIEVSPADIHAIFFTSGTTGRSKGSLCANGFFWEMANWREAVPIDERDVFLADLPFYHSGIVSSMVYMIAKGGRIVVRRRPALSSYWDDIRQNGVTTSMLVGSMVDYLIGLPEGPKDRDHPLKTIMLSPLPRNVDQFKARFGVENVITTFGSTEMGSVFVNPPTIPLRPRSCGKLRPGIEVRLVDEAGADVPVGTPGELLVRTTRPLGMSRGYVNQPEATAAAWRGGWFHSGDRMSVDEDGYYYFFDRVKDALRRRGENVSTFEVEREVKSYPGIVEAACIGVKDDLGTDQEIKVFLLVEPGVTIDYAALTLYLADRMPHYMVPRYLEIVADFPKTATGRVRKFLLRDMPASGEEWDRIVQGIIIGRDGLRVRAGMTS